MYGWDFANERLLRNQFEVYNPVDKYYLYLKYCDLVPKDLVSLKCHHHHHIIGLYTSRRIRLQHSVCTVPYPLLPLSRCLPRPTALLHVPSGLHPNVTMQSLNLSPGSICPIQVQCRLFISSLILLICVILMILSLLTRAGYLILRILLKHLKWNGSYFFSSPLIIFHVSHP